MAVGSSSTVDSHVVIKLGGEALACEEVARALADDITWFRGHGANVVLVHGGGPQVSAMQKRLGMTAHKIGGRRVTDKATLEVMTMVVAGSLNASLCAKLGAQGVSAVGINGASAQVVRARRRPPMVVSGGGGDPVDFGLVGEVVGFNRAMLDTLFDGGFVPVIACLGVGDDGQLYNINADTVANQLAVALSASHLFLVTSVSGVLSDMDDPDSRIARLSVQQAREAIATGVITGGMIPKIEEAIAVIESGGAQPCCAIHILGTPGPGDLRREANEPGFIGTALIPDEPPDEPPR